MDVDRAVQACVRLADEDGRAVTACVCPADEDGEFWSASAATSEAEQLQEGLEGAAEHRDTAGGEDT